MSESEALVTIPTTEELFAGNAMEGVIACVKEIVNKHVPDISTAKGRSEIASLARKVASTKVFIDNLGKDYISGLNAKRDKVNAIRKNMRDTFDLERDYARQPLTDWESEEKAKADAAALALKIEADEEEAYRQEELFERERIVQAKEAELARQAEERWQKKEAERLDREQKERDERIAKEAADKARRDAEAAIQAEKDRADEAIRFVQEEADRKERERLNAEEAEQVVQERIKNNGNYRAKVEKEALADLGAISKDCEAILKAIKAGEIRHVSISY